MQRQLNCADQTATALGSQEPPASSWQGWRREACGAKSHRENVIRRQALVTSGMQGFEGDVQGYSREAEGEAQPVQETDLIAQQMSCQQQSADFLQEGDVLRRWRRRAGAPGTPTG